VKDVHAKGTDSATPEEKEKYLYKPTFKPLWRQQVGTLVKLARVRTIHVKGIDSCALENKERHLYKPSFKPLWRRQVCSTPQFNLCRLVIILLCDHSIQRAFVYTRKHVLASSRLSVCCWRCVVLNS